MFSVCYLLRVYFSPLLSLVGNSQVDAGWKVNMTTHTERTQFIERLLRRDSFILLLLIFTKKYRTSRWKKLLTFLLVFVGPSVCVLVCLHFYYLSFYITAALSGSITAIGRSYLCANVCFLGAFGAAAAVFIFLFVGWFEEDTHLHTF